MTLDMHTAAIDLLAEISYDPRYGARPLKRNIQRLLLNPLAKMMLAGDIKDGDTVVIKAPEGGAPSDDVHLDISATRTVEPDAVLSAK